MVDFFLRVAGNAVVLRRTALRCCRSSNAHHQSDWTKIDARPLERPGRRTRIFLWNGNGCGIGRGALNAGGVDAGYVVVVALSTLYTRVRVGGLGVHRHHHRKRTGIRLVRDIPCIPQWDRWNLLVQPSSIRPGADCRFRSGSPYAVEFVEELLLTVNCPVAAPAAVGSKVSVTLMAWPGFSVAGRLTGEAAKPLPVTATEFTVTGAVPVEVSVSVWVVALLTTTAPNAMLPVFRVRAGVAAFNCSEASAKCFRSMPSALRIARW